MPTLRTPRLVLRELSIDDAPAANVYERDPEIARYQSHDPRTLAESEDYIRRVLEEEARSPRRLYDLAITLADGGVYVGRAGFAIQSDERQAMLWYVVAKDVQGRGLASEAARALVDFAFGELRLHRVFADVDPRNVASSRVLEKLGFRKEAHHVENCFLKGEWCDSVIYARLAREHSIG